ncbi:MAG: crossover junction endodeoxyribonuclease RuvC [Patescibacteria group bacterium]
MIVLGIDPGTASTGYGVLKFNGSQKPELIDSAVISTPAGIAMSKRLRMLYENLHELMKVHTPEVMVIERLFFNTNVKTAMSVGQARGIPLLVAAHYDVQIIEYTALQAKQVLTGYGRANKKELQSAVKQFMNLEEILRPDDANDAVAMGLCYFHKDYIKVKVK